MSVKCFTDITAVTLDPAEVWQGAIRTEDDIILEAGPAVQPGPNDEVASLPGRIVTPALVVAHHHLYSALARGMPAPNRQPTSFPDILEYVWWVLDRALDGPLNEASAQAGLLSALRCGVGAVVDHHASPAAIPGSLDRIGSAYEQFGMRGILCYEVSDRWGPADGLAGVVENERFAGTCGRHPLLRAAMGAHASFTIGDETFDALARACERSGAPIHIHVLEDASDRTESLRRYGADPIARLDQRGLLREGALLAHCVHVTESEMDRLGETRPWVLHNPRSNMNNHVGRTPLAGLMERAVPVALGTDGIDGDMITEARAAFFRGQEDPHPPAFDAALTMLSEGHAILRRSFGKPFGRLEPGAPADLTFFDYDPPTPLTAQNLAGHILFGGMGPQTVESVMVAGRFLMKNHEILTMDEASVLHDTRTEAARLWEAMRRIAKNDQEGRDPRNQGHEA